MKKVLLFLCLCIGSAICFAQKQKVFVALTDELRNFFSITQWPLYRTATVVEQASTYDPTGGNNDGFRGTYSFVRRNADSSLVMIDIKGPGVVNRIWTPTPTKDTLDVFIDDSLHPAISVCYNDLFSGKVFPFIAPLCDHAAGGFFCYFPLLFQQRCKIVCRGKQLQFHQIQYRLFPKETKVESYGGVYAAAKALLNTIATLYNKPKTIANFYDSKYSTSSFDHTLHLGETKELFHTSKGGRIEGIELTMGAALDSNLYLRIVWDNETKPAVDCPLINFFGYAFGKPAMRSLLIGTETGKHYCYIPMPFDKAATIAVIYKHAAKATPIHLTGAVYYTHEKRDIKREGKLYTCYTNNNLGPNDPQHIFLYTEGKGHYIGTILQAQGFIPSGTPFFEGDDSCATDGVFRIHGTGSEDYFNGGWYDVKGRWDTTRSLPLSGCLTYSRQLSRTGGYRFYLNDKIPFETRIYLGIEHGPTSKGVPVMYTSVAFYYADKFTM